MNFMKNFRRNTITFFASIMITLTISMTTACASEPATKDDVRMLMELIKEQQRMIEKRFEQVDKRFEQVDKRFEFLQALLIALFVASVGSPFLAEKYRLGRDKDDKKTIREIERLITAMRSASQHDAKMRELLNAAHLV